MSIKNNLPSVVSDIPRDLRDWINRVRETLERVSDNQGGSGTTIVNNYYGPGGGGGSGDDDDDDDGVLPCGDPVTPTAPTGLSVSAGFGFFLLTWDKPTYCGHSYTQVWGLRSDDLGAAVLLGSSIGQTYSHVVDEQNAYWCFWIRHVNILGRVGPYNRTGGTCARTALDPEYLIGLLQGKITESELYRELGARIDLIEITKTQVETERRIREDENGVLAQRVDTVWAVADEAKAGVTDVTTARIGYCGRRPKGTTGAYETTAYENKTACEIGVCSDPQYTTKATCEAAGKVWEEHAGSGTYEYKWFTGLPWATAVKQVAITVPDQCFLDGQTREVVCLINGRRDSRYTTQAACQAAGGVWRYLNTQSNCTSATGEDNRKGVWITGSSGALEQAFNAQSDELGRLSLQYTVKIDAGGHIAGFGLSSEPTTAGPNTSKFIVRADDFAVAGATTVSATAPANPYRGQAWLNTTDNRTYYYWSGPYCTSGNYATKEACQANGGAWILGFNANGTPIVASSGIGGVDPVVSPGWKTGAEYALVPFIVTTAPWTAPGGDVVPPGVYMNSAYITHVDASSIRTGYINANRVNAFNITAGGTIRGGSVIVDGGMIQSGNYSEANKSGWALWTNGGTSYARFYGGVGDDASVIVRGTIEAERGWFKGCLLGGAATEFDLGTGFFAGWANANGVCVNPGATGAVYKWRVGTAANQRMIWDGSNLRIWDGSNKELVRYGTSESWLRVLDAVDPNIERVRIGTLSNGAKGIEIRDADGYLVLSSGGEINLGASANLVRNSEFAVDRGYDHYWNSYNAGPATRTVARDLSAPNWKPMGLHQVGIRLVGDGLKANNTIVNLTDAIAVRGGTRYELSAYVSSHRCNAQVWCKFFKADGSVTGSDQLGSSVRASGGTNLSNWGRSYLFVTAPTDAAYCHVGFNVPLPDTGVADCYAWATRFYLGEAKTSQTALSPWSPSTLGDIGDLGFPFTEATISTYIAGAAIGTLQVAGGTVTSINTGVDASPTVGKTTAANETRVIATTSLVLASANNTGVFLLAMVPVRAVSAGGTINVYIKRGTTVLAESGFSVGQMDTRSIVLAGFDPGSSVSGTVTYDFVLQTTGQAVEYRRQVLIASGAKR